MKKRSVLFSLCGSILLITLLACNLTPTGTPAPGSTVPTSTETPFIPAASTDTISPPLPADPTITPIPPIGLRAAYNKGGNIWLWSEGASPVQLTFAGSDSQPSISADGTVVAFRRGTELWAINADATMERQLVSSAFLASLADGSGESIQVNDFLWQPLSHNLYFNTLTVAGESGFQIPRFDLFSINADLPSGSLVNLESPGSGGVPTFSQDGRYVALSQNNRIFLLAVDGSSYTEALSFPSVMTYSEWFYVPQVVWLTDSTAFRVAIPAEDQLDPAATASFWHVPVSGTPALLTSFLASPVWTAFPYVSPDGGSVVYFTPVPGGDLIKTIRADGSSSSYVWFETGQAGLVGWTPDSVHFMYYRDPTQVGVMATGEDRLISDTPACTQVRWIDTSRFFFLNGNELRLRSGETPSLIIDTGVNEYDFNQ